jgi:hypothetical protein
VLEAYVLVKQASSHLQFAQSFVDLGLLGTQACSQHSGTLVISSKSMLLQLEYKYRFSIPPLSWNTPCINGTSLANSEPGKENKCSLSENATWTVMIQCYFRIQTQHRCTAVRPEATCTHQSIGKHLRIIGWWFSPSCPSPHVLSLQSAFCTQKSNMCKVEDDW